MYRYRNLNNTFKRKAAAASRYTCSSVLHIQITLGMFLAQISPNAGDLGSGFSSFFLPKVHKMNA
jgi:hypothetical protein